MKRGTVPRTKSPRLPQKVPPAQKLFTRPEGTYCAINDTCVFQCFRVLVDNNRNERNRERLPFFFCPPHFSAGNRAAFCFILEFAENGQKTPFFGPRRDLPESLYCRASLAATPVSFCFSGSPF